jgi:hypothetical protein
VLGSVCGLSDAEELTIVQLYKYHESYHLHSVSIIGTVRAMHVFPPLPVFDSDRCSPLYGVAQFELVDETGSLPVETLGSCLAAAAELPHDGDVIELTAEIQVFVPEGQRQRVIKAITQKIAVLKVAPHVAPAP